MLKKLFPSSDFKIIEGKIMESGTSHLDGKENSVAQRWVKVNNEIITRVSDGLYHGQWDDDVVVLCDKSNYMVGYWNVTKGSGSTPNYSAATGSVILVSFLVFSSLRLNIIPMHDREYGDIWTSLYNYIWKSEYFLNHWWSTVFVLSVFSLYGFVWTPIYAICHVRRELKTAAFLKKFRNNNE
jgi:hypothetical protein